MLEAEHRVPHEQRSPRQHALRALAGGSVESTDSMVVGAAYAASRAMDVVAKDTCRVATDRSNELRGTPSPGSLTARAGVLDHPAGIGR